MELIQSIDITILKWIHGTLQCLILDSLCPILRTKTTWIPLYLLFTYYIWRKFPDEFWKIFITTILVTALCDILCARLLKPLFQRTRPCQIAEFQFWLNQFPFCSQTYSFPSCHAMNHASLASFLFYFIPKTYRWLLAVWVVTISFSQVYIGVHYPSDVIGGILIGATIGYIGSIWIRSKCIGIKEKLD